MKKPVTQKIAVIGAGIAGLSCARTLISAGHDVTVLEKETGVGGRMATLHTDYGSFDHGVQYFTITDPRFKKALGIVGSTCQHWSTLQVPIVDAQGHVGAPAKPSKNQWIASPTMDAIAQQWAQPILDQQRLHLNTEVIRIERDTLQSGKWQLVLSSDHHGEPGVKGTVLGGFDKVILATPAWIAQAILASSLKKNDPQWAVVQQLRDGLRSVQVAPCWSVMLAFALSADPAAPMGPKWNAARSSDNRVAWLSRELSKPARHGVERWTVHATANWSTEHFNDTAQRVQAKLLKSFADITGIHAEPTMVTSKRWLNAKTTQPLGVNFLWQPSAGIGVCGDYCRGYRVEDAFVSGLEMALVALKP